MAPEQTVSLTALENKQLPWLQGQIKKVNKK